MNPAPSSPESIATDTGPDIDWERLRTPLDYRRHRVFLTAEWRHLVLFQYAVDPALLTPLVPHGTTLDTLHGQALVSLVAFRFRHTHLRGLPIPLHTDFPEVNLRFYVRRAAPDGTVQRGVVFIREIVPKPAITWVANTLYGENYATFPMACSTTPLPDPPETAVEAEYHWGHRAPSRRHAATVRAVASGPVHPIAPDSDAWWVTQHFHGFAKHKSGGTTHYQVAHPSWRCWPVADAQFEGDVSGLYGPQWQEMLRQTPVSVYFAEGSKIAVLDGERLR